MQQIEFSPAWKKFTLVLMAFLIAVVIAVWAKPTVSGSTPAGAAAPVEAAMSPMELMVLRGRHLPATDYVEPF
jgi:hypothetical protein